MKVILVHNNFSITGGAEVFFHETARILKDNGHEVALFCSHEEEIKSVWKDYFPKTIDYKKNKLHAILNFNEIIYSLKSKRSFANLVNDFKPDLVHVFGIYVKLTPSILHVCKKNKIPVLMSCNDYKHITPNYKLFPKSSRKKSSQKVFINKQNLFNVGNYIEFKFHEKMNIYRKNIDEFLFASNFMAVETEKHWGANTFKWSILKNPFNSLKYKPGRIDGNYYLYFGRLSKEKGVDILIKAASENSHCKLKIVGDGPEKNNLIDLSKKLKTNNIEFCGPLWGSELDKVLYGSRFTVVPSIWHENFPYVILQSFAMAKPVIGSRVGGIPELIKDNYNGLVYDFDNVNELASKIKFLWDNNSVAINMGQKAKLVSDKNFNDEVFYNNIINIYNKHT